jgi:hypothetical protein
MATAATMESATTTAMEASAAHVAMNTAGESASNSGCSAVAATIRNGACTITRASVPIAGMSVVPAAIAVHTVVSVIAISTVAIPWAGSDKDAAAKPRWAIVPIRRAGVGIVAVVAISADGSRIAIAAIHWAADSNSNRNLRMGISRSRERQDTE